MLNDSTFYQPTEESCSKSTMKNLKDLLKLNEKLTKKELNYILDFEIKTSSLYGLPKIHKSKLIKEKCKTTKGDYLELLDPDDLTFRPIIAGPSCETHRLSNLLDILLKPFLQKVNSYVRDDLDFLSHFPLSTEREALLVSFDVINLYTNISHSLGKEAIAFWLNKYPELIHRRFNKEFIIKGIEIILENNNFLFNDQYYNQKKGTAMGTKVAPTYANLVLGYLEQKLLMDLTKEDEYYTEYIKQNWKRFLDDCFILWLKTKNELCTFHQKINSLHPDIKFTMEFDEKVLPFLDILVQKNNNKIETDIYSKETDTKQYLTFNSCHPRHITRNIPYNLARRICTIVSNEEKKILRLKELKQTLINRNYPKNLINNSIKEALKIPRETLLSVNEKNRTEILPYVSTFNPKNTEAFKIIKNNLPTLLEDKTMSKALKDITIIKSKRQPPNLKKNF